MKEKLEISNDKIIDMETKNEEFHQLAEWDELKHKEIKKQVDFSIKVKDETIEELKVKVSGLETIISNGSLEQEDEEVKKLKKEIRILQEKLQDSLEDSIIISTKLEKDEALHSQQISFYNTQLKEAKDEQEDSQKAHESLMMAFKSLEYKNNNSNVHEVIQNIRTEQQEELKSIENKYKDTKQSLMEEIDQLNNTNNKFELELKVSVTGLEKENNRLKEQIDEVKNQKSQLVEDYKVLEDEKLKLVDSIESHYREKVGNLEEQINEKNKHSLDAMEDIQTVNQKQLEELKEFYEEEKVRLENRITNEKASSKKKLDQLKEELEEKLKEEEEIYEEELYKQLEGERANAFSKVEYLENALEETRKSHSEFLEKQMERFSQEKAQLKEEVEKEYLKNRNDVEKGNIEIESLNTQIQTLKDESMKQILDFTRKEAIINQKLQFKNEKVIELVKANEDLLIQCEEKIQTLGGEILEESEDKINQIQRESNRINEKYEAKRKAAKGIENDFNKLKAEKDRNSIIYEQQILNLENNLKRANEKYEAESEKIKEE